VEAARQTVGKMPLSLAGRCLALAFPLGLRLPKSSQQLRLILEPLSNHKTVPVHTRERQALRMTALPVPDGIQGRHEEAHVYIVRLGQCRDCF
jgi:hypothetical protein